MKIPIRGSLIKAGILTTLALISFAGNSILCRLALRGGEADAVGFTVIRLVSGAVTLVFLVYLTSAVRGMRQVDLKSSSVFDPLTGGRWSTAVYLVVYAICFSLAYLQLTAGTGALILFGSVQLTMVGVALVRGERPRVLEWLGMMTALGGLTYLVFPGLASPPIGSSLLMAGAGVAWGLYTLGGRGTKDPLGETAGNFVRALPFVVVTFVLFFSRIGITRDGILLATLSGSVTSGVGYAIWYMALKYHSPTRAAVLQLSVPVLTAFVGIIFLAELPTARLAAAAVTILGGIGLTNLGRERSTAGS